MRPFKKLATGFAVAATTSLVMYPLEAMATPSLVEDWDYVPHVEPCVPKVTVSDNVADNTIRVQVRDNTCQISREIYLYIQDDRPQPLRLRAIYSKDSTWVVNYYGVKPGRYRVMGLDPTPNGIGDNEYISAYHLGIDQVITIGSVVGLAQASTQQLQPVAPPPPVEAEPPQQVVTTLDPESKQLLRDFEQWSRNFDQWMRWFQVNIWPQLQPLIRAIEGIKTS